MTKFIDFMNENAEKMELYTVTIPKVHGKSHPEAFKVREIYSDILSRTQAADSDHNYDREFEELREITNDYTVPSDVCETYEAVYKNLEEADEIYQKA